MLLVDEVISESTDEIVCRRRFRSEEFFFQGHYPGYPLVPGVILCECAAQSAALLISRQARDRLPAELIPVLARMNNVRFKRRIHPGDEIDVSVRLTECVATAFYCSAVIRLAGGPVAATLDLVCTAAPSPADTEKSQAATGQQGNGQPETEAL